MKEINMKKQAIKEQMKAYEEYLKRQEDRGEIIIPLPEKKKKEKKEQ